MGHRRIFVAAPATVFSIGLLILAFGTAVPVHLVSMVVLGFGQGTYVAVNALSDHNVDDHVIERVVNSAFPITGPGGRRRYIAELRVQGYGVMSVWVEVDRQRSNRAPDPEPLGVVTAYCKIPAKQDPENKCPEWVNDSLR